MLEYSSIKDKYPCWVAGLSLWIALQINVGTALSGPSILYGKTQPYLRTIDLHDHYYFQGPAEQKDMAVRVFANMGVYFKP